MCCKEFRRERKDLLIENSPNHVQEYFVKILNSSINKHYLC